MQLLQDLQADYKAEVVGASLLAEHRDISRIIIDRLGINPRSHTKDLYRVFEETGQYDLNVHTVLQTFRQSIYDTIPEALFHPPTLGGIGRTNEEIVEEVRIQRKREEDARKFFKPFEQEASYIEMHTLLLELMYEQKATYDQFYSLFEQAWPILRGLPEAVALSFIYVLPILHQVRGDRLWTERCLSFVTGFPVTITENYHLQQIMPELPGFTVSGCRLGIDSNFGGMQYDGISCWDIAVGPIPETLIPAVLPESGFIDLIELLTEHFIPSAIFTRLTIHPASQPATVLNTNSGTGSARLGYSFFL